MRLLLSGLTIIILSTSCGDYFRTKANNNQLIKHQGNDMSDNDTYIQKFKTISLPHYWKDIDPDNYLFAPPTNNNVEEWKRLCEEKNPIVESLDSSNLIGYSSINQYISVQDFYELWYYGESLKHNDNLTLWRLEQYDTVSISPNSEYERFTILKERIRSLCDFEPQFQMDMNLRSGFEADLQEFYDRILLRETIKHSDDQFVNALKRENDAWLTYHTQVDSAFRIIDGNPEGMVGSAWSMAISGIIQDDALIRESSLNDFYFTLTDGPEQYELERHTNVSEQKVWNEYNRFMDSFVKDEANYSILKRKEALSLEMNSWKEWMDARKSVSSLLSGQFKEAYDNATNNVRRMKYIMLKNRYSGYGVISDDIYELQIPYDSPDEMIDGPSFDERWNKLYND